MSLTPVPSGLDVQVNTYTISSQVVPSVAALSDGGFVVTWTSLNQDGSDYGTYGQRYASNGKAIGDEFRLNQIAAGNQIAPAESSVPLATLTDGRLVQVWEGYGSEEVFFRLIDMSWGDNGLPGLSGVTITGTAGNDTVDATTTVPGQPLPTEEDDVIYGLAGADNLNGLAGNDRIDGGPGADVMTGGPGDDTYVVDDPLDEVTELEDEGIDEVESAIAYTLGSHVERLTLTGNQAIDGTGNSLNNRIVGNAMANRIDGGAGQDDMAGRGGDDTYLVDHELDTITEEAAGGTDTVISTAFLFTLPDEVENLTLAMGAGDTFGTGNDLANFLLGNAGINTLVGNGGGDTLDGGAGADYLLGGVGNDFYRVDDTFDLFDEGGAFPAYAGSALDFDTLSSTAEWFWDVYSVGERLVIEEGAVGSDGAGTTIVGSVFSNEMIGNSGTNIMFGRGGSDTYRAGDGGDWISLPLLGVTDENAYLGVDGPNTIIVDARTTGAFSYDIIFEFESGKDKIDVSDFGYATATEVFLRGHDDGFGNSYYALGDGLDYVYLVGLTVGQLSVLDFVV